MYRMFASLLLVLLLAGCEQGTQTIERVEEMNKVSDELERVTGGRPKIGINWQDGVFDNVSLTFSSLPPQMTIEELVASSRAAINQHLPQQPHSIDIHFSAYANWSE